MRAGPKVRNLEELLDRLGETQRAEEVSLGRTLEAVGRRSFGPLLLLAGIIPASPLSGIPAVPTLVAVIVALVTGQLLLGQSHFWLPSWVLRRTIARDKFDKTLAFLRPIARFVDRLIRPRLTALTREGATYVIAALCLALAVLTPPLELVPFASTVNGLAFAAFGLALIARDGLLALAALLLSGAGFWLVVSSVFGG